MRLRRHRTKHRKKHRKTYCSTQRLGPPEPPNQCGGWHKAVARPRGDGSGRECRRSKLMSEETWILEQAKVKGVGAAEEVSEEKDDNTITHLVRRVGIDLLRAKFHTQLKPLLDVLSRTNGQDPPDFGTFTSWYKDELQRRREAREKVSDRGRQIHKGKADIEPKWLHGNQSQDREAGIELRGEER